MMEEEQSIEISSVAPLGFQNDDVQSLNSDDAATVESFNNSGGRTRIVKLAVAGLAVAAVAIGLGVGFGTKNNANANLSTSSARVNGADGLSILDCEASGGILSSGKVSLAAFERQLAARLAYNQTPNHTPASSSFPLDHSQSGKSGGGASGAGASSGKVSLVAFENLWEVCPSGARPSMFVVDR